jgi:hypothetical protein
MRALLFSALAAAGLLFGLNNIAIADEPAQATTTHAPARKATAPVHNGCGHGRHYSHRRGMCVWNSPRAAAPVYRDYRRYRYGYPVYHPPYDSLDYDYGYSVYGNRYPVYGYGAYGSPAYGYPPYYRYSPYRYYRPVGNPYVLYYDRYWF